MFKRRKPLTLMQIARQALWPSMGWIRTFIYSRHRLLRLSDTTHNIALGLAIGSGISFSPLLGTHFIQAVILAWILRVNIFSAMMGTFIGNPWTFPFIWWGGISLGKYLFTILGIDGKGAIPDNLNMSAIWDMITTDPMTLFLPWMLGGYILLIVTLPISYPIYYILINSAKSARLKVALKRRKVNK